MSQTPSPKGTANIGFEGGMQITGINDILMPISKKGIGYTFGLGIEYYVSELIKIRGAIMFDNRDFSLERFYNRFTINDSTATSGNSYWHTVQNFSVNYLTIPLSIIYIKGTKKFRLFVKSTFYYSLYLGSNQTGYNEVYISPEDAPLFIDSSFPEFSTPGMHQLEPEIQKFNTYDIGINMFVGVENSINEKVALTLAPCFSYSFGNVWENPSRNANWSQLYQINLGVLYKIK